MNFYMLYQPQFQDSKIVGLEALLRPKDKNISIDDFINTQKSSDTLDISVIKKVIKDLENNKLVKTVSINIHPSSLLINSFLQSCVELCSNLTYNVVLELIEYETYEICQKMIFNMHYLKSFGIEFSVDDFGKNFSNADTIIQLPISKVKIDGSLIDNIENNSLKFKFLNFINGVILDIVDADVVFEKVENLRQFELIELINSKAIIQGYYFEKPMTIEDLISKYDKDSFAVTKAREESVKNDLFDLIFEYIKQNIDVNETIYSKKVNDIFRKHDRLKLTHNSDFDISWENFRDSFLSRSCDLKNQFIRMINTKERLVIVRNSLGVTVFDNITHIQTVGMSLVGVDPHEIIYNSSEYSMCILRDDLFLKSNKSFEVSQEYFSSILYEIIREKIVHNNETFVMCSIYKSDTGIESENNRFNVYDRCRDLYCTYLNREVLVVEFEKSSKEKMQELYKKIFNLYVLAKTLKVSENKFIFVPNVDMELLLSQLDIIEKNSNHKILNREIIVLKNQIDIENYL